MSDSHQRTIQRPVQFSGVALHSGHEINVEIRPASANTGIVFQRTDLLNKPYIKATPETVYDTSLATRIGSPEAHISTIEHFMAALFGFGIDNAIIEINSNEMPVLDGSAAPFLVLLDEAGIQPLKENKKILVINKIIEVIDEKNPSRFIRIEPSKKARISYAIDFPTTTAIGRQSASMNYSAQTFCEEFAMARTFCLKEEVDYMRSRGLAKGGSMKNAIVVSKTEGILNEHGLRHEQEFVRHKILDCIGDLHLIGMPILGHIIAHKAGHDLHNKLARSILKDAVGCTILNPSASMIKSTLKDLLSFPNSLNDVHRNLTGLAVG